MGAFKQNKQKSLVDEQFGGGVLIYLEAEFDGKIFREYLFSGEEGVHFQAAGDGKRSPAGCRAVKNKVAQARSDHILAFGLVDRDVLFQEGGGESDPSRAYLERNQHMNTFLEADDDTFELAMLTVLGRYVRAYVRWELENYLMVDMSALVKTLRNNGRTGDNERRVRQWYGQVAPLLSADAAARTSLHRQGKKHKNYGSQAQYKSLPEVEPAIEQDLNDAGGSAGSDYHSDLAKISLFAGTAAPGSDEWWKALTRILEGKALIHRFTRELVQKQDEEAIKFTLAECLAALGHDEELRAHIDYFKREAGLI